MNAHTQDSPAAVPRSLWNVHCTVCGYTMSGVGCFRGAGIRGFFFCPNCRSGLEMRGRWISAGILAFVTFLLILFSLFVAGEWHRTVGFFIAYTAAALIFLLTIFFCLKVVIRVHRRDVDASFVL